MANALANWLPDIFQAVEPFVSTAIEGGLKWFNEIESNLKDARFGIVWSYPRQLPESLGQFRGGGTIDRIQRQPGVPLLPRWGGH